MPSSQVRLIVAGRGEGKTTRLTEWALEDPDRILVVADGIRAERVIKGFGLSRRQVLTLFDIQKHINQGKGSMTNAVAIDDLDEYLKRMVWPFDLQLVAMTGTHVGPHKQQVL